MSLSELLKLQCARLTDAGADPTGVRFLPAGCGSSSVLCFVLVHSSSPGRFPRDIHHSLRASCSLSSLHPEDCCSMLRRPTKRQNVGSNMLNVTTFIVVKAGTVDVKKKNSVGTVTLTRAMLPARTNTMLFACSRCSAPHSIVVWCTGT